MLTEHQRYPHAVVLHKVHWVSRKTIHNCEYDHVEITKYIRTHQTIMWHIDWKTFDCLPSDLGRLFTPELTSLVSTSMLQNFYMLSEKSIILLRIVRHAFITHMTDISRYRFQLLIYHLNSTLVSDLRGVNLSQFEMPFAWINAHYDHLNSTLCMVEQWASLEVGTDIHIMSCWETLPENYRQIMQGITKLWPVKYSQIINLLRNTACKLQTDNARYY